MFLDAPNEPWLTKEEVAARCLSMGLSELRTAAFVQNCEFIGIGCFCAVTRALQALGVKRYSYPFDWTRSPVEGVIHLLETDFEDFLTFTVPKDGSHVNEKVTYTQARWGGSFWHHEPETPKSQADFVRRIERLLGIQPDVPASFARVFVRSANSARELGLTLKLYETLVRYIPASRIFLLILVDLQEAEEMLGLHGWPDVLVYRVPEETFAENYKNFSMRACAENYAKGIALAARVWAGAVDPPSIRILSNLNRLNGACDQMDGGSAGSEGFWPRRFRGQQIALRKPVTLPKLLPPQVDVQVPEGARQGDILMTQAFGMKDIRLSVPEGAVVGQLMRLRLVEGAVSATLVAMAAATATATAAALVEASLPTAGGANANCASATSALPSLPRADATTPPAATALLLAPTPPHLDAAMRPLVQQRVLLRSVTPPVSLGRVH